MKKTGQVISIDSTDSRFVKDLIDRLVEKIPLLNNPSLMAAALALKSLWEQQSSFPNPQPSKVEPPPQSWGPYVTHPYYARPVFSQRKRKLRR